MLYRYLIYSNWKKKMHNFMLVLWKNYRISRRHLILTSAQVVLPTILFILIAYARSNIDELNRVEKTTPTINEKYSINHLNNFENDNIYYTAPSENLDFYNKLIKHIQLKFQMYNNNIKVFDSELELLQYYQLHHDKSTVAVIFQGNSTEKLSYILRSSDNQLNTAALYDSKVNHKNEEQKESQYLGNGLLSLQLALDTTYIELKSQKNLSTSLEVFLQIFPYPPYKAGSLFETYFNEYLPFVTLLSFAILWSHLLLLIIREKKSGAKELMKMVGLKSWMLWMGWFIHAIIPIVLSLIIVTILMKVPIFDGKYPPVEFTNGIILFTFLFLYCINVISFCFAFSTLFSKGAYSVGASILVWLLSYGLPTIFFDNSVLLQVNGATILFSFFFPNYVLSLGYMIMNLYEKREIGVQWNNIHLPPSGGDWEYSMAYIFLTFILSSICYILLAFYLDAVNPGPFGIKKPKLFPFQYAIKKIFKEKKIESSEEIILRELECFERPFKPVVEIKNVSKKYGSKHAVKNINLNLFENKITVLLGQNGAGKSTLMSMITGMIKVSSGQILFNGRDLKENRNHDKSSVGLCPQDNLLFPDLTVLEHLMFFARLKGKSTEEANEEAISLLTTFNMESKCNDLPIKLSGGMQRKLCLGMAVIGGSKILILDEPTSGLDPKARLEIWDLLLELRKTSTILISTHFMEEAERLGDTIVNMIDGELQYLGSQRELKEKYGSGYKLMVHFENSQIMEKHQNMVETLVKQHIPKDQLSDLKCEKNTITIQLAEKTTILDFLKELEENKDDIDFNRLSIKYTSLDDVLFKINPLDENKSNFDDLINCEKENKKRRHSEQNEKEIEEQNEEQSKEGFLNKNLKFKALMKKRMDHFKQNYTRYIMPFIISVVLCLISLFFINISKISASKNHSALNLTLSSYGLSTVYYNASTTTTNSNKNVSKIYENVVRNENAIIHNMPDTSNAIIDKAMENILYYNKHMVAAAEFQNHSNKMKVTALYSSDAMHSAPISLNLVMNTIAKLYLGENNSISVVNWPLPIYKIKSAELLDELTTPIEFMILIPIALLSFQGLFLIFPCSERISDFVKLQINSGVNPFNYWLVNFIFDSILSSLGISMLLLVCFSLSYFIESIFDLKYFAYLLVMFNIFSIATLPFIYLCSLRSSTSIGFWLMICFLIFLGIVPTISVKLLLLSGNEQFEYAANIIKNVLFSLFPQFGFCYQLIELTTKLVYTFNWRTLSFQDRFTYCQTNKDNPCCIDFNTYHLMYTSDQECQKSFELDSLFFIQYCWLIVPFCISSSFIVLFDSLIFRQLCERLKNVNPIFKRNKKNKFDKEKTVEPTASTSALIVSNLIKSFNSRVLALEDVSFVSEEGECLGILGKNGGGKTTTFKILVRDIIQNSGSIKSTDIELDESIPNTKEVSKYLENIGYCPQLSALNEELSGKSLLEFMASIRGIPKNKTQDIVKAYIELFGLEEYADSPCSTYSGGNKRKLSLAIGLIGLPNLIYLDEPTTGIDHMSRHKIWKAINILKKLGVSIVLSSHDIVESETICDYIKILGSKVDMQQQSPNDWKREAYFGGYKMSLELHNSEEQELVDQLIFSVLDQIKGAQLIDHHGGVLHFHLIDLNGEPNNGTNLSLLFHRLEGIKQNHTIIRNYIVNEFSL